jgi:hypothetical protein
LVGRFINKGREEMKKFTIELTIYDENILNDVIRGVETNEKEQTDFLAGVIVDALGKEWNIESTATCFVEEKIEENGNL